MNSPAPATPASGPLRLIVIVPFYNEAAFLRMAPGSVLGQGLRDAEVLIFNENAAAFPPEWLETQGFAASAPDVVVRVLHHGENQRLSAARNTGPAAAHIAILGAPVRVWRKRAGSISSTPPDARTHLLQVQLLEKNPAHLRGFVARPGVPQRFLKRELFSTLPITTLPGLRLILRLGMHKTGSTHLQQSLIAHSVALRRMGVLFAQTGPAGPDYSAVRPGGCRAILACCRPRAMEIPRRSAGLPPNLRARAAVPC